MGVYLISGAAAGILLSLRFNVIILIPGIFLALLIAAFCGVTQGQGIWSTLGTIVVVATAVQLGYLVGTIAPIGSSANRLSNRRRESIASGVSRLV
jgi:putative Ca2+/H+ antiporter (TMEM165/GDT1 family)